MGENIDEFDEFLAIRQYFTYQKDKLATYRICRIGKSHGKFTEMYGGAMTNSDNKIGILQSLSAIQTLHNTLQLDIKWLVLANV